MAENKLSAADLGGRISILYRLQGDTDHPFSEAVGVLQRIDATPGGDVYVIARRDGSTAEVPAAAIMALKRLQAEKPRP